MAIDAIIAWTQETADGLVLELVPRDSMVGPAGQGRLTIVGNRTYQPHPGQLIWGSSGWVEISGQPSKRYYRVGYTRLREFITK